MLDAVVFVQAQSQIDAVLGFLRREERIAGEIPPRAEKFKNRLPPAFQRGNAPYLGPWLSPQAA